MDNHVWKIGDMKQKTGIGKYSFVNRTIKTGTNYLQKRWGFSLVSLKFHKSRKAFINGVK
jgi:predicted SprT family Zn-dependent metalloprotease